MRSHADISNTKIKPAFRCPSILICYQDKSKSSDNLAKTNNFVIVPKIPLFGPPQAEGVRGDFMNSFILKIPLHPPFPKGEYYIFMLVCEPLAHVDSRESGNPDH
jgi:hypothetical protein